MKEVIITVPKILSTDFVDGSVKKGMWRNEQFNAALTDIKNLVLTIIQYWLKKSERILEIILCLKKIVYLGNCLLLKAQIKILNTL